jgi:hypothetical protein
VGRASHEWTGWELGAFQASHNEDGPIRGKVITLCLKNTNPGPLQQMRYVPLDIEPALLELTEADFMAKYQVSESDEFVKFLGQILFAIHNQELAEHLDKLAVYKKKVKELKREIFVALKKRIRDVLKPQKQLIIRYDNSQVNPDYPDIPLDATITELGSSFSLFGINTGDTVHFQRPGVSAIAPVAAQGRTISWLDFKKLVADNPLGQYWCNALANVIQDPNTDNSRVISSGDGERPRRWRLILTTKTIFYNHEVEASLYLVEALQTPYYGDERTTMLLKGLLIISRFRFLFMEDLSEFSYFNMRNYKLEQLPGECTKLITELDHLRGEAVHANLHQPGAFREFVSEDALQEMLDTWRPIDLEIRRLCAEILKPGLNEAQKREIQKLLVEQLKKIDKDVKQSNSLVLGAMALKLKELSGC